MSAEVLPPIQVLILTELAKAMGWSLDPKDYGPVTGLPADRHDRPRLEQRIAQDPAVLAGRLRAIAEFVPPTDPLSCSIYEIAAGVGPRAAKRAVMAALKSGEITRLQANTLIWVLRLEKD
jgi:hypothetical protein